MASPTHCASPVLASGVNEMWNVDHGLNGVYLALGNSLFVYFDVEILSFYGGIDLLEIFVWMSD